MPTVPVGTHAKPSVPTGTHAGECSRAYAACPLRARSSRPAAMPARLRVRVACSERRRWCAASLGLRPLLADFARAQSSREACAPGLARCLAKRIAIGAGRLAPWSVSRPVRVKGNGHSTGDKATARGAGGVVRLGVLETLRRARHARARARSLIGAGRSSGRSPSKRTAQVWRENADAPLDV